MTSDEKPFENRKKEPMMTSPPHQTDVDTASPADTAGCVNTINSVDAVVLPVPEGVGIPRSLRFQIYSILILLSAGLIFGRISATDNVADRALQDYRVRQIPRQLARQKIELERKGASENEMKERLHRTAVALYTDAQKERPTFSANDRSRWLTIRALVEPEAQVWRYLPLDSNGQKKEHYQTSEILRNCDCDCPNQFNKVNAGSNKYIKQRVPYAIDNAMSLSGWDTIDMVKHGLHNEEYAPSDPFSGYLYSSKPTLLPTIMAAPYWVMYNVFHISMAKEPFLATRILLVIYNLVPLVLAWFALAFMVDRLAKSDWTRLFALTTICFGTFISTFAATLNNHLPGVICIVFALYGAFRIFYDGEVKLRYFALTGFFGAMAIACELPAAAVTFLLFLLFIVHYPRKTLAVAVPLGLFVAIMFFGTNYIAHETIKPAYGFKRNHIALALAKESTTVSSSQSNIASPDKTGSRPKQSILPVQEAASHRVPDSRVTSYDPKDWYIYQYIPSGLARRPENARISYWANRIGIDCGEPSHGKYFLHATIGHHGVFSLTPVWCLSMLGALLWLRRKEERSFRLTAAVTLGLTILFFAFYLTRDQGDRNYGGMTSGLRWFFPLIPLWVLCMLPMLDRMAKNRLLRIVALIMLFLSAMSAAYPVWNPWVHPWFYNWMTYLGWIVPF